MFRTLQVIIRNFIKGPVTVPFPKKVETHDGFHGRIILDSSKCVTCGICSYVCVSGAITGKNEENAYIWQYEPGKCAFCAKCVRECPGIALSMDMQSMESYSKPDHPNVVEKIPFPPCPDCGAPTRPVTDQFIKLAFDVVKEDALELIRLCERCRRRRLQKNLFATTINKEEKSK